jgi:hypothetical protein
VVFKVLQRSADGKKLFSGWMSGPLRYQYRKKAVNKPDLGKFFAFDSLEAALSWVSFIDGNNYTEVWEAVAQGVEKASVIGESSWGMGRSEALFFWHAYYSGKFPSNSNSDWNHAPRGTVFCSSLKLREKVAIDSAP